MNITGNTKRELQQKVLNNIEANHLIEKGDAVVVGVSGGPDSVCLLYVLYSLSDVLNIKLYAIHINHMLRAGEAQADEEYTAALCERMGIPLSIVRIDIAGMAKKMGMSLEEAGREARYREFDAYAQSVGAVRIAVAHNRNDQAETVMMHIIRGSGTAGLAGMEFRRGIVIRPLLNIGRDKIEEYCRAAGLTPRTDSTNLKSDFTRNRVRLELFPYINKNFSADMTDSLCRLSAHASADNSYLEQCAAEAYEACVIRNGAVKADGGKVLPGGKVPAVSEKMPSDEGKAKATDETGTPVFEKAQAEAGTVKADGRTGAEKAGIGSSKRVFLNIKQLQELHPAILGRVMKKAVCDAAGSCTGVSSVHYNALEDLVSKGKTGTRAELPNGLRACVTYGILEIFVEDVLSLVQGVKTQQGVKIIERRNSTAARKDTAASDVRLILPGITHLPGMQDFIAAPILLC